MHIFECLHHQKYAPISKLEGCPVLFFTMSFSPYAFNCTNPEVSGSFLILSLQPITCLMDLLSFIHFFLGQYLKQPKLALNLLLNWFSHTARVGITGMCQHAWLFHSFCLDIHPTSSEYHYLSPVPWQGLLCYLVSLDSI